MRRTPFGSQDGKHSARLGLQLIVTWLESRTLRARRSRFSSAQATNELGDDAFVASGSVCLRSSDFTLRTPSARAPMGFGRKTLIDDELDRMGIEPDLASFTRN